MNDILYIVLAFAGLFVLLQLVTRISTFLKKGKEVNGLPGKLGKDVASGRRQLIYFFTHSCQACKAMTPVVEKLSKEFSNIHSVNLARDMDIGRRFGVMGTPAVVLVESGKIKEFTLGAKSEPYLRNLLQS